MNPDPMSEELIELEKRLRFRPVEGQPPELRQRVLNAVADAVAQTPAPAVPAGRWDIRYWAAVAAVVFVILNLSMISASQTEFSAGPAVSPDQLKAEIQTLRQLESQPERPFK